MISVHRVIRATIASPFSRCFFVGEKWLEFRDSFYAIVRIVSFLPECWIKSSQTVTKVQELVLFNSKVTFSWQSYDCFSYLNLVETKRSLHYVCVLLHYLWVSSARPAVLFGAICSRPVCDICWIFVYTVTWFRRKNRCHNTLLNNQWYNAPNEFGSSRNQFFGKGYCILSMCWQQTLRKRILVSLWPWSSLYFV